MVGRTSGPRATSRSPFPPRLEGSGRASVKHLATLLLHGAGLLAGLPVACLTKRLAATLIPVQPVKGASAVAFGVLIMMAIALIAAWVPAAPPAWIRSRF